ncbi:hypothetical protein ACJJTC_002366 [Scirpophaga incertulas]
MENFMKYHVMGSVSQVRMKPGCMPTKFTCQPGRKTQTSNTTERPYIAKKRRMMILEECENRFEESTIVEEPSSSKEIASCSSVQQIVEEVPQLPPECCIKQFKYTYVKHLEVKLTKQKLICNPSRPSINVLSKIVKQIERSDSYTSYTPSDEPSSSIKSLHLSMS